MQYNRLQYALAKCNRIFNKVEQNNRIEQNKIFNKLKSIAKLYMLQRRIDWNSLNPIKRMFNRIEYLLGYIKVEYHF